MKGLRVSTDMIESKSSIETNKSSGLDLDDIPEYDMQDHIRTIIYSVDQFPGGWRTP